ncbi:MAG: DUF4422 domain-containing protein [Oscillospiraceae bacterium]|nr:DUF4422 domain-containing protein [Oscillospiraceae bacterium]
MIYILTHRGVTQSIAELTPQRVLHVGLGPSDSPKFLSDAVGDSIAEKNPYYCELTGIYWLWKNASDQADELIGIDQYRRFFLLRPLTHLNEKRALEAIAGKDIILPERLYFSERSVREQYEIWHRKEDLDKLEALLTELHPEVMPAFAEVMERSWLHPYNMMVCRKKLFDEYCAWLFPILFALEKEIDAPAIDDPYQKRVFGFLAERLLNVWVLYKGLSVAELPIHLEG